MASKLEPNHFNHQHFTSIVFQNIEPGSKVLDLGAGDGRWSKKFAAVGAKVVAVDRRTSPESIPEIAWQVSEVQKYMNQVGDSDNFDLVFLRHLLQFLPKRDAVESFLPQVSRHVRNGGLVAIQTFFAQPKPSFPNPVPSLYSLNELLPVFGTWEKLWQLQSVQTGQDLAGTPRVFSVTELIVRKPKRA